jgi:diacylglycerol kinase (ATP)
MTPPPNNKGLRRLVNAFKFSLAGFKACFRTEEAFRQEIYLTALMVPAAFWIGDTNVEQIVLLGSVVIVLIAEMLNTAIERAIDRISYDKHELSKEAKDMGSAVVFMALVFCGFTWIMIAIPKFF